MTSVNSKTINKFIRPDLASLKPYATSPTQVELAKKLQLPVSQILKMDRGENPYASSEYPKRLTADYFAYPDNVSTNLRTEIANYVGYTKDWIICGNGSDELIDLVIALFVKTSEEVIICPPTFPMYEFCARVRGVKIKKILRNRGLGLKTDDIIEAISSKTKLIFIDSPGNPAGTIIKTNDLLKLLKQKIIVVVDEAYYEYCGQTAVNLIKKFPNLIVLRSFSKWAGLAGLRVGYMVANPKIINGMLSIKPPYNINSVGQELALYALKNKNKLLKKVYKLAASRTNITKKLSDFKQLEVVSGEGAYVLIKGKGIRCNKLANQLKKKGVLVKTVQQPLLKNAFLINLAPKKEIDKLTNVLKLILG